MPADIRISDGTTPSVSPDSVSASSPQDVWLTYELSNVGDEDGTVVNYYITVDEGGGTIYHSEFVTDVTIEAGGRIEQGAKIDASVIATLPVGDNIWVTLRTESGETLCAARLDVTQ